MHGVHAQGILRGDRSEHGGAEAAKCVKSFQIRLDASTTSRIRTGDGEDYG
jgi:hypothetical protein